MAHHCICPLYLVARGAATAVTVLVLGLHCMMMTKLLEQAVVLGMMGVFERLDHVDDRVGRCRRHGKGQRNGGAEYVSHGRAPIGGLL